MQVDGNMGNAPNYYPTTFANVTVSPEDAPPPIPVVGEIKRHVIESSDIDYLQPGEFYRDYLDDEGKAHFIYNVCQKLKMADIMLQYRQTALFNKADRMMGRLIAECLGLEYCDVEELSAMTQEERVAKTMPKGKM